MSIAETILKQLGGNRFCAMTAAKNFVSGKDSLSFRIGKGAINKANLVSIKLEKTDTYAVAFYSVRGINARLISEHGGVFADSLRELFTRQTGMLLSL